MSRNTLKTIFHPFASGVVEPPATGGRVLFLGAEAGFALPDGFGAEIHAVQPLRQHFRQLEAAHVGVAPKVADEAYDAALILCTKHKGENENRVAEALRRVQPHGMIVVAGAKEDGILPLRKKLETLGLTIDHMPKYHGVAVWFPRPQDASIAISALEKPAVRIEGKFDAAPGMFSHDRIDPGSDLLASRLPMDFNGNAADLGAGWGYLSVALAAKSPMVNRIDLFEADFEALEFAKANLASNCPKLSTRFFWQDLVREEVKERYDLVIMNPPFHEGHATEPHLGEAMIKAATTALRNGGRLMMVANRGLSYEAGLATGFREHGEVCRNSRFKVLWARK